MSEFRIERGYRELYISDGDARVSPRSLSPASSHGRSPAAVGVPQYKMGSPTYRSGVYLERDNTRPPRPSQTTGHDTRLGNAHRAQVTYHVQDSYNRESPPPPPYSPPRQARGGYPDRAGRMYAAVYKTENAAVPQDGGPRSPYQERGDPVTPQYTAAYPPTDRYMPVGAPSRIVYSVQKSSGSPTSPQPPDDNTQYRPPQRTSPAPSSPRPYQLKPTMDLFPASPTSPVAVTGGSAPGKEAEVDALTSLLIQNMEVSGDPDFFGPCESCGQQVMGYTNACQALGKLYHTTCFLCQTCGMCVKCGRAIMGDNQGCSALDQLFHIECFSCSTCGTCLKGKQFFAMEGKPYCEPCYMNTLEKCCVCSKPITDRILRATGKPYHPHCFMCVVCGKSLDGVQFTVDANNHIHCIEDFHKKFAPRCVVCDGPIMPETGEEETVRIVAMDRSFHVKCYKCEDCGLQLTSESEGRGCYPLDEHILCKSCNAKRIQAMTTRMMTEL